MDFLLQLGLIILLVLLNGFFVASEFSLVSIRKSRIDELVRKKRTGSKLVQTALSDIDTVISATQLGITIASLALGWIGEPALAHFIEPLLSSLPKTIAIISSHALATGIAFSIITFLHIVLGELAPKSIALQKSETTALVIIAPLVIFTKIFRPFIWVLNGAGILVLKLLGFQPASEQQLLHSTEEINIILEQSRQGGAMEEGEVEIAQNAFRLGNIPIKNIMVPRTDILSFSVATTIKEIIRKIRNNTHSRFPIFENSIDSIIGFIHIKDIYKSALQHEEQKKLSQTKLIRKVLSVPEEKRADDVLLDMRKRRIHLAVVTDEYGGTSGIVTLEDILESLVGEIEDEFDKPVKEMDKQKDGSYLVDGLTSLDRVQKTFNIPVKGQGYVTVGGLVFGVLGREPKVGDSIQLGTVVITIEDMDKKRIKTIKIKQEKKKK